MLKNYFISAWRIFPRYKRFTTLNIFGLSLGLSSSIFIFLWVSHEPSPVKILRME
jgi:putative ABC transport system permease protein